MYCKTFKTMLSDEGMTIFKEFFTKKYIPLLMKQPGFKGTVFCLKENNEFMTITYWEEEKNLNDWSNNPEHKEIVKEMKLYYIHEIFLDMYKIEKMISLSQ